MCDLLVALGPLSVDGVTRFAKNSDRPPGERQLWEWHPPRLDSGPLRATHMCVAPSARPTLGCMLSRPAWGWGAEHGVNVAGVAAGNAAVYTRTDPRPFPPALTGMDLVRLALERAATAAEAVEVVTRMLDVYGQGGSGHDPATHVDPVPYWSSFLVADPGAAFVIDTSGPQWAVEVVAGGRALSNRTSVAGFDEQHRHPRQPVERRVEPRQRASQDLLSQGAVTTSMLMQHLARHDACADAGWSVCMHVDDVEATTASMVAELRPGGASTVWVAEGAPCTTPYRRIDGLPTPSITG